MRILRRLGFLFLTGWALWPWGCGGPSREDALRFPEANLVLISVDTLRADHLSAYGYERVTSPELEKWLSSSVLFTGAFSQSPKTATSHMTMMTGLNPGAHGVRNWWRGEARPLGPGVSTLAGVLARAGYRCGGFTGGGNVSGALGFARGFERFEDGGQGSLEEIVGWTEGAAGDGPYFLFFHTFEVHDPYMPPDPYDDSFDPLYQGPLRFDRKQENASLHGTKFVYHDAFWERFRIEDERERARLVALYDGEILYTDQVIASLLEQLRKKKLLDNTILVFTADHGEEFFERGGTLHNTLHQEILRVPLLMRLPGDRCGGVRVDDPVRLLDVTPTLLDLLALPSIEEAQGRSLVPHLLGERLEETPIFAEWKNPNRDLLSLREGKWKLIWDRKEGRRSLYSVDEDPREQIDLAGRFPDRVTELLRRIEQHEREDLALGARLGGADSISASEAERRRLEELGYVTPGDGKEG